MGDYLVVYHGSAKSDATHDEQLTSIEASMKWMGSNSDAIKDAGHPASRAWTVSNQGTSEDAGANPATGYTVLTAESMQAALDIVVTCPHVAAGGNVELIELLAAGHASAH